MKTISITPSSNLDLDKLNEIISKHDITRNALVNRFLVMVVNGTINLDSFLKDDLLVNSEVVNLTARLDNLESKLDAYNKIPSKKANEYNNIDITNLDYNERSVQVTVFATKIIFDSESLDILKELEKQFRILGCDSYLIDISCDSSLIEAELIVEKFSHLCPAIQLINKIKPELEKNKVKVEVVKK